MTKQPIKRLSRLLKVNFICVVLLSFTNSQLRAQEATQGQLLIPNPPSSIALKVNLLYAATLTPNLALEIGLGKKTSLELGGGYNFYDPDSQKHWKHWLVQPEFRYWFCERFNGTFLGVHAMGGEYNFSKIDLPLSVFSDLEDNRYEGYFYGGGISVGHQWILSKRWNFELSVGVGYVRVQYDKYPCTTCGSAIESGYKNYFGPTKAAVSFLLFL